MDALRHLPLTKARLAGALALSTEAGWNQIEDDWTFMLDSGSAFGIVDGAGRLVASGLTVEFPRYAWISMILVTPAWRRKGLATELMQNCVAALAGRGLVPALDASPEGREVYRRIGFRDAGTITRLAGELPGGGAPVASLDGAEIVPIAADGIAEIAAYDAASSGTDRTALLAHLRARLPGAAFAARRGSRIVGYALARPGRMAAQVGPLVADDDALAAALLLKAGAAIDGPFCLDLFDDRTEMRALLDRAGFQPVTRFVRMVHGPAEIFPPRHRTCIIGGPELS